MRLKTLQDLGKKKQVADLKIKKKGGRGGENISKTYPFDVMCIPPSRSQNTHGKRLHMIHTMVEVILT